jgi:glycosyltransferase involved in cell wall biosynthesis
MPNRPKSYPFPQFTTVVTAYNRAHLIAATLSSVVAQTYPHNNIIVIDDGSTDDLMTVLAPFGDRIQFFRQINQGPGAARNLGLLHAGGDYCAFLDGDDLWYPWTLATLAEIIRAEGMPSLILGKSRNFIRESELLDDVCTPLKTTRYNDYFASSENSFWIGGSALTVRTADLRDAGGFTNERVIADDLDMCLRVGDRPTFITVTSPLTFAYRRHSQNISNNDDWILRSIYYLVSRETLDCYPGGGKRAYERRRIICRHARPWAINAAWTGKLQPAYQLFRGMFVWNLRLGRLRFILVFAAASLIGMFRNFFFSGKSKGGHDSGSINGH